jgi:hypothetical protein
MELIDGSEGSIWSTPHIAVPHHVAYWSEDFQTDSDALVREGWEIEVTFIDDSGRACEFGYYAKPGAPRVELVDAKRRDGFLDRVKRP